MPRAARPAAARARMACTNAPGSVLLLRRRWLDRAPRKGSVTASQSSGIANRSDNRSQSTPDGFPATRLPATIASFEMACLQSVTTSPLASSPSRMAAAALCSDARAGKGSTAAPRSRVEAVSAASQRSGSVANSFDLAAANCRTSTDRGPRRYGVSASLSSALTSTGSDSPPRSSGEAARLARMTSAWVSATMSKSAEAPS
mmetsp:Transcript_168404/g.541045  ORF Transcript_168404/g.541045 Transcript_168404/m.541045 type:complete len:202 (+) Transcript_168404:1121-1726(+)